MKSIAISWSIAFAGYLLAAGQVSAHELATSAVLAVAAAAFSGVLARASTLHFALPKDSFRPLLATLAHIPRATGRTSAALWHAAVAHELPAKALTVPFDHGVRDSRTTRTRRAAALLLATLAPDRFVVRMAAGKVLLHAIVPADRSADRRWLT